MLIGSFGGRMYLRLNAGTRSEPIWDAASLPVQAGGEELKVPGKANPVAIDWDGDRLWDLVVSASDGSVRWYRNEGTAERGEEPTPRVRSQLCVVDYDLDGKLDLLVGDYDQDPATKKRHSYVWLFRQL